MTRERLPAEEAVGALPAALARPWLGALVFVAALLFLLWSAPDLGFYLRSADHGYQLGLARQVLLGKMPYVDLFFHYGPLVALTSAAGLLVSDSLVPETVICALGYAACIFLVFRLTAAQASRHWLRGSAAGIVAAAGTLLLLARYYKWYYWLLPLIALEWLRRLTHADGRTRGNLVGLGVTAGIALLYRFDLGFAVLLASAAAVVSWSLAARTRRRTLADVPAILAGFALPLLGWLLVLGLRGGLGACRDYFAASLGGATGMAERWSLPFPHLRLSAPFSPESTLALTIALAAAAYLAALLWGVVVPFLRRRQPDAREAFLAALGWMGLAVFPQGLFRADAQHLLQIIPPAVSCLTIALVRLWESAGAWRRPATRAAGRLGTIALALLAGLVGLCLGSEARLDLRPLRASVLLKYQGLAHLGEADDDACVGRLAHVIVERTRPDDAVLVVPLEIGPQLHFFAPRPVSGLLHGYAAGLFDSPAWRRRNLNAVLAHPPRLVVARANAEDPRRIGTIPFGQFEPELDEYLRLEYRRRAFKACGYVILERGPSPSPPQPLD